MTEKLHLSLHFRKPLPSESQTQLLAGAGECDITPPPGIPKGGYSAMSKIANGFRTRLKVRAFYIKPVGAAPVLILQADLHAGSALLRNLVAEALASRTDIPASNLCLTCTHTHAGPGQLLESDFYNDHASCKPGLDPELLHFVVDQMVAAGTAAYQDRKPARIAAGARDVWGASRNRSLPAFTNNLNQREQPTDIFRAINPRLFMLRIDQQTPDGDYKPRAAFSTFSIHGTSVPVGVTDINADLWAYVERHVALHVQQQYQTPWPIIHGPCQGTHGDLAPDIRAGQAGFPEARRLGLHIARQAVGLFEKLADSLQDQFQAKAIIELVDTYQQAATQTVSLARRPAVGNALVAGAYENSTPVLYHMPFFKRGSTSRRWLLTSGEQGHKRVLGSALQPLLLRKEHFPHQLTLQLVQLGNWILVAVPFEVTVEAGRRIAASVESHFTASAGTTQAQGKHTHEPATVHAVVTSLANGYTGYTTTPEEYAKQHYEGGHTLYGPNTTPWLCDRYAALAGQLNQSNPPNRFPDTLQYHLKQRHYWPRRAGTSTQPWQWAGSAVFHRAQQQREAYWSWDFLGDAPGQLRFHEPLAHIEVQDDNGNWEIAYQDGVPLSDDGYDLGIKYLGADRASQRHRYQVRWYNPTPSRQPRRLVLQDQCNNRTLVCPLTEHPDQ